MRLVIWSGEFDAVRDHLSEKRHVNAGYAGVYLNLSEFAITYFFRYADLRTLFLH